MFPLFGCICLFVLLNSTNLLVHCFNTVKRNKSSEINTNGTSDWLTSGGHYTEFSSFPHVVYIVVKSTKTQCTGTFIAPPGYILSAAHCFFNPKNGSFAHPEDVFVHGGSNVGRLNEDESFFTWSIRIHPYYTSSMGKCLIESPYDLAVVVVSTELYDRGLRNIALPGNTFSEELAKIQMKQLECFVTGYGITSAKDEHHVLNTVKINIMRTDHCQALGLKVGPTYHVCAYTKGRGPCPGDDGAPLMCNQYDDWDVMVGMLSIPNGCSNKEMAAVFIRIDSHMYDFIHLVLSGKSGMATAAKNKALISQRRPQWLDWVHGILILVEILNAAIDSK